MNILVSTRRYLFRRIQVGRNSFIAGRGVSSDANKNDPFSVISSNFELNHADHSSYPTAASKFRFIS